MRLSAMSRALGWLLLGSAMTVTSFAAPLPLERLPQNDSEKPWKGHQFVAADRAGRLYFLRADTFEVYPLAKAGLLGEPVRLQTITGLNDEIREAVISPAGDAWLL